MAFHEGAHLLLGAHRSQSVSVWSVRPFELVATFRVGCPHASLPSHPPSSFVSSRERGYHRPKRRLLLFCCTSVLTAIVIMSTSFPSRSRQHPGALLQLAPARRPPRDRLSFARRRVGCPSRRRCPCCPAHHRLLTSPRFGVIADAGCCPPTGRQTWLAAVRRHRRNRRRHGRCRCAPRAHPAERSARGAARLYLPAGPGRPECGIARPPRGFAPLAARRVAAPAARRACRRHLASGPVARWCRWDWSGVRCAGGNIGCGDMKA